ncbi:MAG: DoxX family protein [Azospira oryzae]|jgi:putative oxidoreductase|nr:MAG: DoxX family protein [Azospira oryzae]
MKNVFLWISRLLAAMIMLQTLYFKFTASEESVYIFSAIGMEPWGRIAVGIMELIASLLLIITSTAWLGALLSLGLMLGAIGMHLTLLGIEVKNDGGYLFILSLIVTVCSLYVLYSEREKIAGVWKRLRS